MAKCSGHFPREIRLGVSRNVESCLPLLDDPGKGLGAFAGIPPLLLRVRTDRPHTEALTDQGGRSPDPPSLRGPVHKLLRVVPAKFPTPKASRVRALTRLIRYSGLAIRDAVALERRAEMGRQHKARVEARYRARPLAADARD